MPLVRDDINEDVILSAIAEGSKDAITRIDPEGTIVSWTRGAERMMGYSKTEALGKPITMIVPPEDHERVHASIEQQFSGTLGVIHEETFRITKLGRRVPVMLTRIPLVNPQGETESLLAILKDNSEKMHLQKQVDTLERNNAMAKVAAKVAHEIRTPLGVLFLKSDMLTERMQSIFDHWGEESLETHKPRLEKCVTDIQKQISRLEEIANTYLHLSKSRITERQNVNLRSLLEEVVREQKPVLEKNGVQLVHHGGDNLPEVFADPQQIQRVLQNLIKNSHEALSTSKIPRAQITIGLESDGDWVWIDVQDNGPGMPQEIREDVFDPFITTKSIGTGLGLYLAKEIIQNHNGAITISSEEDQGTRVRIQLPPHTKSRE